MQDRRAASRELIEFLAKFSCLLEDHLQDIHNSLVETSSVMMNKINEINKTQSMNNLKAKAILVKDQNSQNTFEEVSAHKVDRHDQMQLQKEVAQGALEKSRSVNKMKNAGHKIKSDMKVLTALDKKLEALLFSMTGVLSVEDVLSQRLNHVIKGVNFLNLGLAKVLEDFDENYSIENVKAVISELKDALYKTYTTEQEKNTHKEVFNSE